MWPQGVDLVAMVFLLNLWPHTLTSTHTHIKWTKTKHITCSKLFLTRPSELLLVARACISFWPDILTYKTHTGPNAQSHCVQSYWNLDLTRCVPTAPLCQPSQSCYYGNDATVTMEIPTKYSCKKWFSIRVNPPHKPFFPYSLLIEQIIHVSNN